jgi:hypothetical protein
MKRIIILATSIATALSFQACVPKQKPRQKPATGPKVEDSESRRSSDSDNPDGDEPVKKKKRDDVVDPTPATRNDKVPPPPTPNNPEYAIKVDGKPGYVKSPYDAQGRLIDVRGLPPGTEAECPYSRRTFLVPP